MYAVMQKGLQLSMGKKKIGTNSKTLHSAAPVVSRRSGDEETEAEQFANQMSLGHHVVCGFVDVVRVVRRASERVRLEDCKRLELGEETMRAPRKGTGSAPPVKLKRRAVC